MRARASKSVEAAVLALFELGRLQDTRTRRFGHRLEAFTR